MDVREGGNITWAINLPGLTTITSIASAADYVMVYSASAAGLRKILPDNLGILPPFSDATAIVKDAADATKRFRLDAGTITTATTRVGTLPDEDLDFTPGTGSYMASDAVLGDVGDVTIT